MKHLLHSRLAGYQPKELALDYPEAGILVPITDNSGNPEMVFTLRSLHLKSHRGQVAYPGGKRDPEDHSVMATALRETHEEIGLPPDQVQIVSSLGQVISSNGILVTPYVGIVPEDHPLRPNPAEIESIFRVPLAWLLEDRRERTDAIPFMGRSIHVPCYRWKKYQIWGLSAIVLVDFMNAVYDAGIDLERPPSPK